MTVTDEVVWSGGRGSAGGRCGGSQGGRGDLGGGRQGGSHS